MEEKVHLGRKAWQVVRLRVFRNRSKKETKNSRHSLGCCQYAILLFARKMLKLIKLGTRQQVQMS